MRAVRIAGLAPRVSAYRGDCYPRSVSTSGPIYARQMTASYSSTSVPSAAWSGSRPSGLWRRSHSHPSPLRVYRYC